MVGLELALVELPDLLSVLFKYTRRRGKISEILVDNMVSSGEPSEVANISIHHKMGIKEKDPP